MKIDLLFMEHFFATESVLRFLLCFVFFATFVGLNIGIFTTPINLQLIDEHTRLEKFKLWLPAN
jgi:hypothetical protein